MSKSKITYFEIQRQGQDSDELCPEYLDCGAYDTGWIEKDDPVSNQIKAEFMAQVERWMTGEELPF